MQGWAGLCQPHGTLHGHVQPNALALSLSVGTSLGIGVLLSLLKNTLGYIFTNDE